MMLAVGWFIVAVPRQGYKAAGLEDIDRLDDEYDGQDEVLWNALEHWLGEHADGFLQWNFTRHNNNARGLLQVSTSRNHRVSCIWDLLNWLAQSSSGSYGVLHVHDDEDRNRRNVSQGGADTCDHSNEFRIWCLKRGSLCEHADTLLSPLVPAVKDAEK